MRGLAVIGVAAGGIGVEALDFAPFHDGGVIRISEHRALWIGFLRRTDHAEQRLLLRDAVYHPGRIENLVAAVLGIGLREHGEFGVGGIAAKRAEIFEQIVDLVGGKREAHGQVGFGQRRTAVRREIDCDQRPRRHMAEQLRRSVQGIEHRLGHAIVQHRRDLPPAAGCAFGVIGDAALYAPHRRQAALARDVGGLGRPGRDRADARHHQNQLARRGRGPRRFAIDEQLLQQRALARAEGVRGLDEVPEFGAGDARGRRNPGQAGVEFFQTEGGQRGAAAQLEDFSHESLRR